ncbi:MAG: heterodisulfide reductase subunit B [Actinobacteria bacterium]|nr:heterodisulfide reductase subunit B [Actinomycetota bacterium]
MTRLAYYPGCSLRSTARELDRSFRASAAALGLALEEIPRWECCGTTAAHTASRLLAAALPANELAKVPADMGLNAIATPCAACFSRFVTTRHELREDEQLRREVEIVVGRPVPTDIAVLNLIDVYHDVVGLAALRAKVTRPLRGLRIAAYYGCLLTRPPAATLAEDPEYPTRMDAVLGALDAEPVAWSGKTDCCGASLALCDRTVVIALARKIVANARACGAQAIATACPLCQLNLDTCQADIRASDQTWASIPVFYLSQLVGHAVGVPARQLGWRKHVVAVPALP